MRTRREFAKTVGLGAIGFGLAPSLLTARQANPFPPVKDPKYRTWSEDALREAKRLGCTYADIRFTRNSSTGIAVRNGRLTGAGNIGFGQFGDEDTFGFGVRVIHSGVWGFCQQPGRRRPTKSSASSASPPTWPRPARSPRSSTCGSRR